MLATLLHCTSPQSLKGSYSADVEKGHIPQQLQDHKRTHGSRTLLSEAAENHESGSDEKRGTSTCALCKDKHDLDICRSFLSEPLSDRKVFIQEKGLCFGCLQFGYISKRNEQRKKCTTCSKHHPTSLHGDTKGQQNKVVNTGNQDTGSSSVSHEAHTNNTCRHAEQSTQTSVVLLGGTVEASKCSMIVPVLRCGE